MGEAAALVNPGTAFSLITAKAGYDSYKYAKKAQGYSSEASRVEGFAADSRYRLQRLAQIRAAQQRRASVLALSVAAGTDQADSGYIGGQGSIFSQLSSNLAFLSSDYNLNKTKADLETRAAEAQAKSARAGAIFNAGMQVSSTILGAAG